MESTRLSNSSYAFLSSSLGDVLSKANIMAYKPSRASSNSGASLLADFVNEYFSGNMTELVDYMNLSLRMINKHIDREEDPSGVANVIDNLFELQQSFIACARGGSDELV